MRQSAGSPLRTVSSTYVPLWAVCCQCRVSANRIHQRKHVFSQLWSCFRTERRRNATSVVGVIDFGTENVIIATFLPTAAPSNNFAEVRPIASYPVPQTTTLGPGRHPEQWFSTLILRTKRHLRDFLLEDDDNRLRSNWDPYIMTTAVFRPMPFLPW